MTLAIPCGRCAGRAKPCHDLIQLLLRRVHIHGRIEIEVFRVAGGVMHHTQGSPTLEHEGLAVTEQDEQDEVLDIVALECMQTNSAALCDPLKLLLGQH